MKYSILFAIAFTFPVDTSYLSLEKLSSAKSIPQNAQNSLQRPAHEEIRGTIWKGHDLSSPFEMKKNIPFGESGVDQLLDKEGYRFSSVRPVGGAPAYQTSSMEASLSFQKPVNFLNVKGDTAQLDKVLVKEGYRSIKIVPLQKMIRGPSALMEKVTAALAKMMTK